ncbi:flavin monoamine oxidase family protein [Catalinimonas sp. 4WD22]|uniref:flavin monoamine oxidase family protein n=1 Tax=Catalinimonas locisalis TaxID=3133978 RepID=UPI00310100DF
MSKSTISRRAFLNRVSVLAGSSYPAMVAMGMIQKAPNHPFKLQGKANGTKVIILGAGLAGMTSAYEMNKLGYDCTILEARNRPGGRVWTVRGGTQETEEGGVSQSCNFDKGQYLNAGAARIPHHHEITMHYCREMGIPLQIFNNVNENAFLYSEGKGPLSNKPIRIREVKYDMQGYICELLNKAIDQEALDLPMTNEDKEKLIEFLRVEGGLNPDMLYTGDSRRGYKTPPGAGNQPGVPADAYELMDLINSGFIDPAMSNLPVYTHDLQMTLFEPVGGMDRLPYALAEQVKDNIKYESVVNEIRKEDEGVRIVYTSNGKMQEIKGDYCICTLPLPVLANVKNDLSSNVQRACDFVDYKKACKIGLQFKRRFWEEDENIFGGLSRTNTTITQIMYPNYDYLGKKGVLKGFYNFSEKAEYTGNLSLKEREQLALEEGSKLHPQYKDEFENSFSLAWHKIPYSMGGWAEYNDATRQRFYPDLIKPDGNIYLAGEHTSYHTAWMAGAFESARRTVSSIHTRVTEGQAQYESKE